MGSQWDRGEHGPQALSPTASLSPALGIGDPSQSGSSHFCLRIPSLCHSEEPPSPHHHLGAPAPPSLCFMLKYSFSLLLCKNLSLNSSSSAARLPPREAILLIHTGPACPRPPPSPSHLALWGDGGGGCPSPCVVSPGVGGAALLNKCSEGLSCSPAPRAVRSMGFSTPNLPHPQV